MNIRTAAVVDISRQAFVDELQGVLDGATAAEANVGADETLQESARQRFKIIGDRIVTLSDQCEHTGKAVRVEEHTGVIELGTNGYTVEVTARRSRTNASFMPWAFSQVEARWRADDESGIPLAIETVTSDQVLSEVTPKTLGMLSLLEQSLDTVELARGILVPVGAVAEA